ncbi:hypothetical protein LSH36_292g00070 [Paralvinella palmiformis]|uniref:Uncharacterized protein n=1 Tax=Paralvinella palmiformis TaxID=53620 RepID=A0AAD9N1S6_9ANNE|nr:hypothetical protein LSH36_292g00070 [Paralvinella palmiformis]
MAQVVAIGLVIGSVIDVCVGRGNRGDRYIEPQSEKRTYPSEVRRMYYVYYMNYFTVTGMKYAKSAANNPRTVTICSNYEPYFNNGTYLGEFPCPMEQDPDTFSHCCGDTGYEYCCRAIDSAAVLGLTLAFIACVVMNIQEKRRHHESKKQSKRYMDNKGIPHYNDNKTRYYSAIQSYDGYQILVTFHKMRYYYQFYEKLRMKYVDISWRYDEINQVTEGKIAYSEDDWVNLIISDDYEGSPIMIVMRERTAVAWMEKEFYELTSSIPVDSSVICCCGCVHTNKTYPSAEGQRSDCDEKSKHKNDDCNQSKTNLTRVNDND